MKNDTNYLYRKDDSIYPGNYVSLLTNYEVADELNRALEAQVDHFPVRMTDSVDTLKIEMAIPGIKREEFFLQEEENGLSVIVLHKNAKELDPQHLKSHHLGNICFEQHIALPKDVDMEFFSAEYAEGILCIHISKTLKLVRNQCTQLVVY